MIGRWFRRSPVTPQIEAWWQQADALADGPLSAEMEATLAAGLAGCDADERENREEMLDGLRALADLRTATALPVIVTQHRAVGGEVCHAILPVSLADETGSSATLFLTASRLVLMHGRTQTWPWHRVILRRDRRAVSATTGPAEGVRVQCNSFADALRVVEIARRLGRRG